LGVPHILGRKIVGGTVSPRPVRRKAIYVAGVASAEAPMHPALTFQPSNHSFIQLFEMQLPHPAEAA
jgi:hypothetical protein